MFLLDLSIPFVSSDVFTCSHDPYPWLANSYPLTFWPIYKSCISCMFQFCSLNIKHTLHLLPDHNLPCNFSALFCFPRFTLTRPVMVRPLVPHVLPKPCLHLWWLDLFPMLSDWPLTQLGHQPTSHSLSQTPICFCDLSLLDTLDSPCLHFNSWPSYLTSVLCTPLSDSISDSCIVADMVGTPQLDLWGLPLCQVCSLSSLSHVYVIELRLTTVSVCHICWACPCLRESLYTSGFISVSPSHDPQEPSCIFPQLLDIFQASPKLSDTQRLSCHSGNLLERFLHLWTFCKLSETLWKNITTWK